MHNITVFFHEFMNINKIVFKPHIITAGTLSPGRIYFYYYYILFNVFMLYVYYVILSLTS